VKPLFTIFLILVFTISGFAQAKINGIVKSFGKDSIISGVNIKNINSKINTISDNNGEFNIDVKKGNLLEISHVGYQTIRIRIYDEHNPNYYNIVMKKNARTLQEIIIREKNPTYSIDSLRTYETYKLILDKPAQNEISATTLPMEMMSRKFREEQAFRTHLKIWEREKYIDFMFNDRQLKRWTGLPPDKLQEFMRLYRPGYDFLRSINEYKYLQYLKNALAEYCPECKFQVR
jgi:NAD+--asparagine ADP-ribosyltransferase